jgi:hypothetical protein
VPPHRLRPLLPLFRLASSKFPNWSHIPVTSSNQRHVMLKDRRFYKCALVAEDLLKASKEDGLVANTKKTTFMFVTSECNAGQYHSTQATSKSFHNMIKLKYV